MTSQPPSVPPNRTANTAPDSPAITPDLTRHQQPRRSTWLGIAAPVLGILGIILSLVPVTVWLGFACGLGAIGTAAVGLARRETTRAPLVIGLVLGAAAVVIALISALMPQEPEQNPTLVYKASSADPATVTYYVKGKRQTESFKGDWETTLEVHEGTYALLTVEVSEKKSLPSPVSCELLVDGESATSSEGLQWALCSVTVEAK